MASTTTAYDAALDTFARALPWLTTLSVLAHLPRLSHDAFNLRRAQQIYDGQGARPAEDTPQSGEKRKPAPRGPWTVLVLVNVPLLAALFVFLTTWAVERGRYPRLAAFRSWVPCLIFSFMVIGPMFTLISRKEVASGRLINVFYRRVQRKRKQCCVTPRKASGVATTQQHEQRSLVQLLAIPFVAALLNVFVFSNWLDARLALGLPSAIWAMSFHRIIRQPLLFKGKYVSLRGLILIPTLVVLFIFGGTFAILALVLPSQRNEILRLQCNAAYGWEGDVAMSQLFCLIAPLGAWLATILMPAAMCTLGYRYDASELTTPTLDEQHTVMLQSRVLEAQLQTDSSDMCIAQTILTTKTLNKSLTHAMPARADPTKTPVVLSLASLPRSAVRSTPTFTAGFVMLVAIHAMLLVASFFNTMQGLLGVGTPRLIRSRPDDAAVNAMMQFQFAHLAIFLVPAAMLIAAERAKKGGAKQLWNYYERWSPLEAEETHEELALRPSLDEHEPLLRAGPAKK